MGIGTSLGAYFDDTFSHAAGIQSKDGVIKPGDTGDDNVLPPNPGGAVSPELMEVSYKSPMPFADNSNPDTDFKEKFRSPDKTGDLTEEDLQRAGLKYKNVEDRTNEGTLDQLMSNASALKQWGHNLIHPDPLEPIPDNPSGMAKDLGFDSIKADEPDRMRDMKLMYDKVINDALSTGRIFKGMYEGLKKELNKSD